MKIAMISYNTFVSGQENGWTVGEQGSVLLLQNSDGRVWGTSQSKPLNNPNRNEEWHGETRAIVDPLWELLEKELPTIDKVVFYVGSTGAERVIELAAKHGLDPQRAIFVFCNCNYSVKNGLVKSRGFSCSKVMGCECGGHATMNRIYQNFLAGRGLP